MSSFSLNSIFLLVLIILLPPTTALNITPSPTSNSLQTHISYIQSLCKSTPYPETCFKTLKFSIDITIAPNLINSLMHTLQTALWEATKISDLFFNGDGTIIEKQKGTLQDCHELHQTTVSAIKNSVSKMGSFSSRNVADARIFLSAALTNKITCLEGLNSASGSAKSTLLNSLDNFYKYICNSLSLISKQKGSSIPLNSLPPNPGKGRSKCTQPYSCDNREPIYELTREKGSPIGMKNRKLLEFPSWLPRKDRLILQDEYDPNGYLSVAADETGNFSTISDAINFAPNNSYDRVIIYVKEGIYEENVEIPSWKTNIVLLGDGADLTVIRGNRSVRDGWTTFRSATVAVSGMGFLARDIAFENNAGPEKGQAVALRINADLSAVFRCTINGYQDTLYVHSYRQFYRECNISGTIDYIFGNAAVVFQGCNIVSRMPLHGQGTVITAQSRNSPDEPTGISIQNCSILATEELYSNVETVESYLGRPWRNYSTTVFIESYIDDFIAPEGWSKWSGEDGLDTLYYGEYENYGPGSDTENRVAWPGYHVMDFDEASQFTVSEFITGEEWIDSTSFPYDDGI